MHLIKYQRRFNRLFTLSDYFTFKTSFISSFSDFYIFKTLSDKMEGNTTKEIWELKPKNRENSDHRHFYFYISFLPRRHESQPENSFTWIGLGEPNTPLVDSFTFQLLYNTTTNLARVPDVIFENPLKVSFCGETYTFSSKTKLIKNVTPVLASKITSTWSIEEKCALARCILSKQQSLRNFKEFISHLVRTKVRDFLVSFSLTGLSYEQIEQTFSSYYNLNNQYLIYKF